MKSMVWALAGALISGSVLAVPQYGPTGPYRVPPQMMAPQTANPGATLRRGVDKLLTFLDAEPRPSAQELAGFLNSQIAPFFDFGYMAQSAGGRLFERLSAAEQAAMVEDVKRSFLVKMAEKLAGYGNQQVRYLPPRGGNDGRTVQLSVAIVNPGRYPARLDFRLFRADDGWKVYDVAANGQSAIVHYRRELMRQAQQRQMQQMRQMTPPPRHSGPRPPYPYGTVR